MAWLKKYWWLVLLLAVGGLLWWVVKKTGQTVSAVLSAPGAAVSAAWTATKSGADAVGTAIMNPAVDPIAGAAASLGAATSDWHPISWMKSWLP